jgi:hypothetical protein
MAEQRDRELVGRLRARIVAGGPARPIRDEYINNDDQAAELIAAHVAEAVKPFAQAIVDDIACVVGKGYECRFCQSPYEFTDHWQVTHEPGCIVPVAMKALEEGK